MIRSKPERDNNLPDDRVIGELRTANRLLAILATRGMEQRDAIAMLHGMAFPPRAIAAALSITPNAVSIAIHRIKKAEQAIDSTSPRLSEKDRASRHHPAASESAAQ